MPVARTPGGNVYRQHLIGPVLEAAFVIVSVHLVPEPEITTEPLAAWSAAGASETTASVASAPTEAATVRSRLGTSSPPS